MTTTTALDLFKTLAILESQLLAAIHSHTFFKFNLDATDEDIAIAIQLEAKIKDLKEQVKALQLTVKVLKLQ